MGYAVPEDPTEATQVQEQLSRIMEICQRVTAQPTRVQGPKRPPTNYQPPAADGILASDDEEDSRDQDDNKDAALSDDGVPRSPELEMKLRVSQILEQSEAQKEMLKNLQLSDIDDDLWEELFGVDEKQGTAH